MVQLPWVVGSCKEVTCSCSLGPKAFHYGHNGEALIWPLITSYRMQLGRLVSDGVIKMYSVHLSVKWHYFYDSGFVRTNLRENLLSEFFFQQKA